MIGRGSRTGSRGFAAIEQARGSASVPLAAPAPAPAPAHVPLAAPAPPTAPHRATAPARPLTPSLTPKPTSKPKSKLTPKPRLTPARAAALATAIVAFAAGGCGSKAGDSNIASKDGATLVVTRDFGATELRPPTTVAVGDNLSAMRQLQSSAKVETSYGGRYVTSIDGVKQNTSNGYEWLFYVDGVESDVGASAVDLTAGQTMQWDYHRWQHVKTGGAIVGAFPAPFKKDGAALECIPQVAAACVAVKQKLREAKIRINTKGVPLKVGAWADLARRDLGIDLSSDPAGNGAFAAFPGDLKMQIASDGGDVVRTLGRGSGLIAAFAKGGEPLWIITGVDTLGVEAAVGAFTEKTLKARFTVAVGEDGAVRLPVVNESVPK